MSAADLIAMGVEVMAEDEAFEARQFTELSILIAHPGIEPADGLREVVRMIRDAADSAWDAHADDSGCDPEVVARMKRFAGLMTMALEEIR